jgi:type II pantothenate kinase
MKIGIDVGISTTKIVGITSDLQVVSPTRIKATDPVTSLYGAFGKFLFDNHITLSDIEKDFGNNNNVPSNNLGVHEGLIS